MATDNTERNRNLILVALLAIMLTSFVWWFFSKPAKPIQTKGSFQPVKVKPTEIKHLPGLVYIHDGKTTVVDSSALVSIRKEYELSKAQYDSLVVINSILDSLAMASNDVRYQKVYSDCKFQEFSHTFDNDTLKAAVSGISRGAPERLKLSFELKLPKQKETFFALWTGFEAGATKTFDKPNFKFDIDFQFGKSTILKTSIDSQTRIYVGYSAKIFDFKR